MKKKPVTGVDDGKTKKDQQGARTGSVQPSTNERSNHNHLKREETVVTCRRLPSPTAVQRTVIDRFGIFVNVQVLQIDFVPKDASHTAEAANKL